MQNDPSVSAPTKLLAYGGVFSFFAWPIGVLLPERNPLANGVTALIGVLMAAEGVGLVTNWRRGADEVVRRAGHPDFPIGFTRYWATPNFIRWTLGPAAVFVGCVFMYSGIQ
jgi:hypothetical protein